MNTYKSITIRLMLCMLVCMGFNRSFAQLKADFSSTPQSGCPPLVVSFSDASTGNPTNWKWDLGNNTISYLQNPIATYFNPGTYNVKLIVTNASGVDSIVKSQFITVYSLPDPKFGASDTVGCFPLRVQFTDSSVAGSGNIVSWQWDFGDGNLSNQQSPLHTYTNAGSYTVILRTINSNGCSRVVTKPAFIKTFNGVNANFTYTSVSGCTTPAPVTFTNTSTGTGTINYMWNFGDGGTSTATNPLHNYTASGSYTVTLIATNSFGCTDTVVKTKALNIGMVKANITAPDSICVGKAFSAINSSNPSSFISTYWNFGEGTTGTTATYQMTYANAGTYFIKMVSDFGSCLDSMTKRIVVLPKPKASFTATNSSACTAPLTVSFQNTSTGSGTYVWDFGDGTTSTQANPVHTYTLGGSYTVRLTMLNGGGCSDSMVKQDAVIIAPPRIARVDTLPARGCIPFTITPHVIMADSTITPASVKWYFGDGDSSVSLHPVHTYTTPGAYDVTVIVTNGPGCSDTLKIVEGVRAGNRPAAAFSATPRDACAFTTINFTDLSTMSGGLVNEWYWLFGDGGSSTEQFPNYIYSDTGYFNVTLIASNFGCSDTLKVDNYIHILPPIAIFDTAFLCSDPMKRYFIDKSIGAQTWTWSFGDGNTSTSQNPSHVYADTGTYQVTLKVTNGACQFTRTTPVMIVNENPKLIVADTTNCVKSRVMFRLTNYNPRSITRFLWLPKGLGLDSVPAGYVFSNVYTRPGTYPMAMVVTDVLKCRDTLYSVAPIRIYGPSANFSASANSACFGTTINFYDSSVSDGIHPIVNWTWNFGDTTISYSSGGPFAHFYDTQGSYNVTLTATDSYGCKDSMVKPALVAISKPMARFKASDTSICPSAAIVFTNLSQASSPVYLWQFGDGTTSSAVSPTHTYALPGTYTVRLRVGDRNGCSDSMSLVINVFSAKALFTLSDSFSTCPPLIVDITNQSSNYVKFQWDFGDGGNSQLLNPSHIYTYPGNYTVKLVVSNNGGCADSLVKNVVIQGPTGNFSYVPKTVCNPGQINYSLISNNTVKYIWDYDDGTTVFTTTSTSSHTYTTPGIYLPKIILENAAGCRVPVVGLDSVKVIGIQTNILSNTRSLCDSGAISFRDSTITNDLPVGVMWYFGDGDSSNQFQPTHFYHQTGLYTVTLMAKSDFGCKDTVVEPHYVRVVPSPKMKLTADSIGCDPVKLKFSGQLAFADTSVLSWYWNFGNGQTSNLPQPDSQLYIGSGTYSIAVRVVNSSGCSDSTNIKAVIKPRPAIIAANDTSICKGKPVVLAATGGVSYTWSADPTLSCTTCPNPVAYPQVNTSYIVTGVSPNGCTNKDTIQVAVKQPFKMLVGKGDTICVGKSVPLSASGADNYQWSPSVWLDNTGVSNPNTLPDSTITYTVVGTDRASCFRDSGKVTVKVYPYPRVSIDGPDNQTVLVGNSLQLKANGSSDIISYSWSPGQWLSCANCPNPVVKPGDNISYTLTVKNRGNCEARDVVSITLLCNDGNFYVPNTFSPNGDGSNDVFYPRGKGINLIRNFSIFNRWGQVVYQRANVAANDPSFGWDGTMNGVKMPTDVYVYLLEVLCSNNQIFPVKGNVTLIR